MLDQVSCPRAHPMTPSASRASISAGVSTELARARRWCARRAAARAARGTARDRGRTASAACCSATVRPPGGRPPRRSPGAAAAASSGWWCGCMTLPTGTPASHRHSTISSAGAGAAPARPGARRCGRAARTRPAAVSSAGSVAHSGSPSASRSATHCSSVATAIATQLSSRPVVVETGGAVEVLRRGARAPVAGPLEQRAVGRVLDDLLGGDVERGVDHRRLDQRALAGAVAVLEREQQAEQRVQRRRWGRRRSTARSAGGRGARSST